MEWNGMEWNEKRWKGEGRKEVGKRISISNNQHFFWFHSLFLISLSFIHFFPFFFRFSLFSFSFSFFFSLFLSFLFFFPCFRPLFFMLVFLRVGTGDWVRRGRAEVGCVARKYVEDWRGGIGGDGFDEVVGLISRISFSFWGKRGGGDESVEV